MLLLFFEANLGLASHITVTISASDEAHGVFQFSNSSISVNGTEPEEGRSNVLLQVRPLYAKNKHSTVQHNVWPPDFCVFVEQILS